MTPVGFTETLPPPEAGPSPEELLLGGGKKERLGAWNATAICGNACARVSRASLCCHKSVAGVTSREKFSFPPDAQVQESG
jgi:hypothetical protein